VAGTSASAAASVYDEAHDDVRPEDDDWSTISVVGGRAARRLDRPSAAQGPAVESARAFVSSLSDRRSGAATSAGPAGRAAGEVEGVKEHKGQRAAGLQVVRAAGLGGVVRTARGRGAEAVASTRVLPVLAGLRELLPGGGLRRGATVAVHTSSVLLALLAAASRAGSWCAVVGLPALSPIAAAEMGIVLERLALVPHPGTEWTTIVAALLDGFDIVVAAPPGPIAPVVAGRLAARARQRGSVLMPAGSWAGADLTLAPVRGVWGGIGVGRGRLRFRELTVQARGRGAAVAVREATLALPEIAGVLPPVNRPLPATGEQPTTAKGRPTAAAQGGAMAAAQGEPAASGREQVAERALRRAG
jgi:hypothetical protein